MTFGLLMAGSLVSVANATNEDVPLRIGKAAETTSFVNKKYFVVTDDNADLADGSPIVMGITTDNAAGSKDDKIKATGVTATLAGDASNGWKVSVDEDLKLKESNYLWEVKETKKGSDYYYTFVNVATGKQLEVLSTEDGIVTDYKAAASANALKEFTWTTNATNAYAGGQILSISGQTATKGINIAAGTITFEGRSGNIYLYQVAEKEMTAANLNELGNGTFSLTYKDATASPFDGEMKAFEVKSANATAVGVDAGVYLATSWGNLTGDEITTKAEFQKCTFIALDSYKNWSINDLKADGEGYKFTTVSGKKLQSTTTLAEMKKGYISSGNANFVVTEKDPVDAEGSYTLSLKGDATFMNAKKDGTIIGSDLVIAAVADQEDLIVTSVTDDNANLADFTTTCTLANSNLISVDKLLSTKAASVFNIQFLSTANVASGNEDEAKTKSEYNKFLGINEDGIFAQGSDFVNLEAPENQWIIVDADKDAKTFTFQNRELSDKTFTVKLIATGKTANTYKVVDATDTPVQFDYAYVDKATGAYTIVESSNDIYLGGTTIKLIAAEVNPLAGYVTNELDNAGLVRFVFTSEQKTIADKLYVGAGAKATDNLEVSKDAADALKWSVVKFDASAEALDALVSDTIYAYNDYAYYDAAKKEVKVETAGDTIAVVAYGFKLYGKDKTYLTIATNALQPTANNVEDIADAQRFLIKINKNGSYSLIEVPTAEIDYREIVKADTKAFTVDATDGTVEKATGTPIYYDYKDIVYNFSIEKDAATPSLAHKPAYVTLNADNKGYVAMDSVNFDGIVAPVSLLKAAYTAEELTFRLDTADSEAYVPSFYISHIGKFMYNAKDSADYYNDGTASAEGNKLYKLVDGNAKAIFRAATLVSPDTLTTTVNGKEATVAVEESKGVLAGLKNFKYQIVQATADSEGEYVVKSVNDGYYLYNLNGFLGFTADPAKALVVNVEQSQSPVANEAIATSSIKVVAGNGVVTVIGAQGKKVAISNILGQTIASTVITSSEATISAPAGVVVVAVEGEAAVKAIVK